MYFLILLILLQGRKEWRNHKAEVKVPYSQMLFDTLVKAPIGRACGDDGWQSGRRNSSWMSCVVFFYDHEAQLSSDAHIATEYTNEAKFFTTILLTFVERADSAL